MSQFRIHGASVNAVQGNAAVFVGGKDAYGRHAFTVGDRLCYRFAFPRTLGVMAATLSFSSDGRCDFLSLPLSYHSLEDGKDIYTTQIDTDREELGAGLYFLRLTLRTVFGDLYAYGGNTLRFAKIEADVPAVFQLTISRFAHKEPVWAHGGVIYHVFIDRFFRGGSAPAREGTFINPDWENGTVQYPAYPGAPLANNMFFGGDLDGVRKKISYIASLGTKIIYLSPVFSAASNHKYDTGDYTEVDSAFGGEEALRALIKEAEKYGIRIVLDGVFNHTGADSLYFNRYGRYDSLGAYQSKESPYFHWYNFKSFPNDYETWWGIEILPRLNLSCPDCRAYFIGEGGVISRCADYGIGGMRLDVADELDSDFIAAIKTRLSEKREDSILYGEVWEDASNKIAYSRRCRYYLGDELDGVMNYPLRTGIVRYLREKEPAPLLYYFGEVAPNMPKRAADVAMNLLGTHDTLRILTALGGKSPEGKSNDELVSLRMSKKERTKAKALLKAAYLIAATVSGIPSVYYGDEVGMEGYSDPFNRTTFPWHDIDEDLLEHYRAVAALRKNRVYLDGEMRLLRLDSEILAFSREKNGSCAVTVYNNSEREHTVSFPESTEILFGDRKDGRLLRLAPTECAVLMLHAGDGLYIS